MTGASAWWCPPGCYRHDWQLRWWCGTCPQFEAFKQRALANPETRRGCDEAMARSADCGKRYGPRRLVCVRQAGHKGKHSHIRSARSIGINLFRRKP